MKQTTLSDVKVDTHWPKGHRMRKTKTKGTEDFYPDEKTPEGIMKKAKELGLDTFIIAYSGGKDSGMVLDILTKSGDADAVLHLNTHTGVASTLEFVKDICVNKYDIQLFIRSPTPLAFAYVAFCLEFGFPGPRMHAAIMKILKYNSMKKFIQEHRFDNKKVALVGGIRKFESKERMGHYDAPITRERDLWMVNPLFYETDKAVYEYFLKNGLSRCPAYETLGFSGECNCGSFAEHDEAKRLEQTDKNLLDFLRWIEEGIRRWGTPEAKKYGKWGRGEYGADNALSQKMLDLFFDDDEKEDVKRIEALVCGTECAPGTMRSAVDY